MDSISVSEFLEQISWGSHIWMLYILLIVFFTAVTREIAKRILLRFERRVDATKTPWDDILYRSIRRPLGWLIWVIGISWAASIAASATLQEQEFKEQLLVVVGRLRDASIIAMLAWFTIRFIREFQDLMVSGVDGSKKSTWDPATAAAVGKILRATVSITAFLIILQRFEVGISGVLAAGGIGGIAIGFAARDLLANFFGALMLFIDKPFAVGDWIRSPDKEIEGTVEDIGWRMTRIRTFDQRPLYVPNATFTSITVENPQRMINRRIYEHFGVRYKDVEIVKPLINEVREMLKNHPAIDTTKTLMVNLVSYGDFSVNFFVYTFTKTTVWTEFHEIKEEILLLIAEIVRKHGADFAFPTQTVHLPDQITPEPDPQ